MISARVASPAGPWLPVGPVAPVAPTGIPKAKSNVAALEEPEFETDAVAGLPTVTVLGVTDPTATVAAFPESPLSPVLENVTNTAELSAIVPAETTWVQVIALE